MMNKKYTFFWKGPLSQWKIKTFTDSNYPDIIFNCAEQYMMYRKALIMNDNETAKQIINAKHPREQKDLGRLVKNFDPKKWDLVKEDIVYQGNYLKYTQNEDLKELLFKTVGTTLVEASPYDKIWGIGLSEDDPRALNEEQWQGLNLLGKILTQLRENLMKNENR